MSTCLRNHERHFGCPKPRLRDGYIRAVADHLLPFVLGPLVPPERRVLHEIVENAALLEVDGRRYNGDKDWDEGRKAQTRARSRKPA